MRKLIAAVVAACAIACAKEKPVKTEVRLDKFELTDTYQGNHPTAGNIFVIARVTEDPAPPEFRPLTNAEMEDWDGHKYKVKWGNGFRGQNGDKLDPDRMEYVFEIPSTAKPRSITIPEKLESDQFKPGAPPAPTSSPGP